MRRKIGIFMGEIASEYQEVILKSIFKKAKSLDYDVFVFSNFGAYGDNVLHGEGEKSTIRIPDISCLDGIMVAEDTFDIDGMAAEVHELLRREALCPVVSLRDSNEKYYNVLVASGEAIADMTRHFIYHHGFRDICFMTGDMASEDAQIRYQRFLDVCEEAQIPVTEHMVFFGDYWRTKGKQAVDWYMEGRDTYPQAVICSNDYMATSICSELKRRGVKIPEEVCVSGYDDILEVRRFQPAITSVKAPFEQMGERAVEMLHRVISGIPQERVEWLKPILQFRESCGCGRGEKDLGDLSSLLTKMYMQEDDMKQNVYMITDYQDAFEEKEYLRVAEKYIRNVNCKKAFLCICDKQKNGRNDVENDSNYSDSMILKKIFIKDEKSIDCQIGFTRSELLPRSILEQEEAQGYLVFPVHHKNKIYGYMVMYFEGEDWPSCYVQAYVTGLAGAIEGAYMHDEVSSLEDIKKLYHKDPLTGIYNRRGFEKHLRSLHERFMEEGKYLSIVSIDMNDLKYVNDTFGHAEGDDALCRLANVLQGLVGEDEICARVGGDEFFMLLYSDSRERDKYFEEQFIKAMRKAEEEAGKPYPFRASMGICCFSEEDDLSLMACMQLADKRMYTQKRKNKMMRKGYGWD